MSTANPAEVVVIAGPTASGKSALAARLAHEAGGMVINADSLQLYAALPILTARPGPELTALAPHRLYGVMTYKQRATAAWWARAARGEIEVAHESGRLPVVVGGTGLYLEALMQGLSAMPEVPQAARDLAAAELEGLGRQAFYDRLIASDPGSAGLALGDTQRILRAWEVYSATGRSLTAWQAEPVEAGPYSFRACVVLPERERLRAACDARFLDMVAGGAVEEVAEFLSRYPRDAPATQALGFDPLARMLAGEIDLAEATRLAQAQTRQYAKRQTTWFRNRFLRLNPAARVINDAGTTPFTAF